MTAPKVLIFGVGSIGAVYLYQLLKAGCEVTAVCRSNYDVVKSDGFSLKSIRFGDQTYKPHVVVRTLEECPNDVIYDYLVICSKSFPNTTPSLADAIKPAAHGRENMAIVLAQNGIAIEEEVRMAYPRNPILSGVVYCPAIQTGPGIIEYPEMLNLFEVGTYPADAPLAHKMAADDFAALMIKGGGGAQVHNDVQVARWKKLIMNAAWNPIGALTLCTDGGFLYTSDPFAHELVWAVMMEIVQLAKTIGIPGIDEAVAEEKYAIAKQRAETGTGRAMSMLQDVQQGRPFEVEAIVGNAVRLGRTWNVSMPRLDTIYALSKARYCALTGTGR